MNMLTTLQRSGGIEALARQSRVAPLDALASAKEMLPSLLAALRSFGSGRDDLLAVLERHGGIALAAEVMAVDAVHPDKGMALLAELCGESAADAEPIRAILAMLVGGYVSALAAGHGAGPDAIEDMLAG